MGNRLTGLAVVSAGLSLAACGGSNNKRNTTLAGAEGTGDLSIPRVDPALCDTKGKKVATFDLNKDSQPDVWKLFATSNEGGTTVEILTCKQVDLNHDGKIDYVQTYARTGEIVAEDFDFTFEGSMDAREHYDIKTKKIYLVERDTDHDKIPDVWEKYDPNGMLESIRRDRNADQQPDLWEQYKDGQLIAILYDDDFDNRVDRKDQIAASPTAPATTTGQEPSPGGETQEPESETQNGESQAPIDEEAVVPESAPMDGQPDLEQPRT